MERQRGFRTDGNRGRHGGTLLARHRRTGGYPQHEHRNRLADTYVRTFGRIRTCARNGFDRQRHIRADTRRHGADDRRHAREQSPRTVRRRLARSAHQHDFGRNDSNEPFHRRAHRLFGTHLGAHYDVHLQHRADAGRHDCIQRRRRPVVQHRDADCQGRKCGRQRNRSRIQTRILNRMANGRARFGRHIPNRSAVHRRRGNGRQTRLQIARRGNGRMARRHLRHPHYG